jgi:hypothetical protein
MRIPAKPATDSERSWPVCGEFQILRKEAVKFQVLSGDP